MSPLLETVPAADLSRQAAGLRDWLRSHQTPSTGSVPPRITTLRRAFAREGLAVLPDPLGRYACTKVVPLSRLLPSAPSDRA